MRISHDEKRMFLWNTHRELIIKCGWNSKLLVIILLEVIETHNDLFNWIINYL